MNLTPVTLHGSFVRLEPLSPDHVDGLWSVGTDPEIWRWTTAQPANREEMTRYVSTALDWQAAGTALPFATVLRSENRVIGSTRFANADLANRRVEIGWTWLAPAWQRTAANTEAKFLMLRHAFETLGCIRVEFKTDRLNEKSRRALAGIGAKEEGTLRSHMIVTDGRIRDSVYFSVIAPEWPEVRRALETRLRSRTAADSH